MKKKICLFLSILIVLTLFARGGTGGTGCYGRTDDDTRAHRYGRTGRYGHARTDCYGRADLFAWHR